MSVELDCFLLIMARRRGQLTTQSPATIYREFRCDAFVSCMHACMHSLAHRALVTLGSTRRPVSTTTGAAMATGGVSPTTAASSSESKTLLTFTSRAGGRPAIYIRLCYNTAVDTSVDRERANVF